MTIWKRLKNLWELSKFSQEDYVGYVEKIVIPTAKRMELEKNPRPQATIIKLTPKDDIDVALKEINGETNG